MDADNEDNPFRSPSTVEFESEEPSGYRRPSVFSIFAVVIASIVASALTFFGTCIGLVNLTRNGGEESLPVLWMIWLSPIVAFVLCTRFGLRLLSGKRQSKTDRDVVQPVTGRLSVWIAIIAGLIATPVSFAFSAAYLQFDFWGNFFCTAAGSTAVIWLVLWLGAKARLSRTRPSVSTDSDRKERVS